MIRTLALILMSLAVAGTMTQTFGLIISAIQAATNTSTSKQTWVVFVALFLIFALSWIGSCFLLDRGSGPASKVFARGFLVLAAEWLLYIGVAVVTVLIIVASQSRHTNDSGIGESLMFLVGGAAILSHLGLAVAMALASMIGYSISHLLPREFALFSTEAQEIDESTGPNEPLEIFSNFND